MTVQKVEPRNWVKESLIGLRPVTAGRFVVHGAHDRDRVPAHCIGIEIEAATAFGTGHHGTTRGCLLALDSLARNHRPRHILDLGTGSGILAIAAAKLFRVPVLATDIDARSVQVARDNARLNGVGAFVTAVHAADLRAPEIARRAPFDLVMSNILLRPLQRLAAPMARQLDAECACRAVGSSEEPGQRGAERLPVAGADARALVPARRLVHAADGGAGRLTAADDVMRMAHLPFRQRVEQAQQRAAPRLRLPVNSDVPNVNAAMRLFPKWKAQLASAISFRNSFNNGSL